MLAVIVSWAAYIFLVTRFLFHGLRVGSFLVTLLILVAGFFSLIFWSIHHLTRPKDIGIPPLIQKPSHQRGADSSGTDAPPWDPSPRNTTRPDASQPTIIHEISFHAAGTTFDNEDGSSRQEILRHLKFRDEPYAADEPYMVGFEETTFQGDPAIEIHVNGYMIGFVPKAKIPAMLRALDADTWSVDSLQITGGGTTDAGEKRSYGCAIDLTYTE